MPKHKRHIHRHQKDFFINKIILAAAIIEPLFTLPQAYIIFSNHNARDVSITTWIGFNVLTAIWIWYAYVNKEKIVLLYQCLYFIFNTLVIIGALAYGGTWL